MSVQTTSKYHLTEDQQRLFNRAMWILIGVAIGAFLFSDTQGYLTNVFTEIAGVAGTYFVIDYWVRQRDARQEEEREKERLLWQLYSDVPGVAQRAVEEIRRHGWLTGENSILRGANLIGAKLQEADLQNANLEGATLFDAKLQKANLLFANLQGADLTSAKLQGANLQATNLQRARLRDARMKGANLRGASLQEANLEKAILQGAILQSTRLQDACLRGANLQEASLLIAELQGVNLEGANMQGARLTMAEFDETTVLPDAVQVGTDANGKRSYTPDSYYQPGVTDMKKYTDPSHPDFRPWDDPVSRADIWKYMKDVWNGTHETE